MAHRWFHIGLSCLDLSSSPTRSRDVAWPGAGVLTGLLFFDP